jgi:hypothetical protein
MAALTNPKHELFAKHLAKGESAIQAFKTAGFSPNRGNASRLKANESIQARCAEIKEAQQARAAAPADMAGRDGETGQFVLGHRGPGRPRGNRNRLGEAFLMDLREEWERSGAKALQLLSQTDPGAFCKITASILPKELDQTVIHVGLFQACRDYAEAYKLAQQVLGANLPVGGNGVIIDGTGENAGGVNIREIDGDVIEHDRP